MRRPYVERAQAPRIRVVVGLEPPAIASALGRTAASIAIRLHAEIAGLGVVHTELKRAASLPFSAFVSPGGAVTGMDEHAFAQTLWDATERARSEATAAVEDFGLAIAFDVVEGRLLHRLRSSRAPGDVFVVGSRGGSWTAQSDAALVVLVDDAASVPLVELAARLGRETPERLLALVDERDMEVERLLASRTGERRLFRRRLANLEPLSVALAVQERPARGLVVALDSSRLTERSLRLLRGGLTCPLFLVG